MKSQNKKNSVKDLIEWHLLPSLRRRRALKRARIKESCRKYADFEEEKLSEFSCFEDLFQMELMFEPFIQEFCMLAPAAAILKVKNRKSE
jgi:hypothetical protein